MVMALLRMLRRRLVSALAGGLRAAWVDLDNDGFLDLVVLRYLLRGGILKTSAGNTRKVIACIVIRMCSSLAAPLIYHNN